MGLHIFSIPSISADPERLFSCGKNVLTDTRNCLRSDTLKALEYLKCWRKEGLLVSSLYCLHPIPESIDDLYDNTV